MTSKNKVIVASTMLHLRAPFVNPLLLLLAVLPLVHPSPCAIEDDLPKLGAVASESAVCSRVGTKLLQDGGNAVDALVGTVFCVGVIGMYHSGIGGGGFLVLRAGDGSYEFVDFRETAPAAAFEEMYKDDENLSLEGGLARYAYHISSKKARS